MKFKMNNKDDIVLKNRRNEINTTCERNYPGIDNYYLRCVSDEITNTIRKETLEDTYHLSLDDVKQNYDLNKNEVLKVLEMISKEMDISSNGFVKRDIVEFRLKNSAEYDSIDQMLYTNHPDLYDAKANSLSMFQRSWLPGLVYSAAQAKKIAIDLVLLFRDKKPENQQRDLLNEYVRDHTDLTIDENIQEDGTSVLTIKSNNASLLVGSTSELVKALGLTDSDLSKFSFLSDVEISSVITQYYEHIQKAQMEGIVDNQKDLFIKAYDLDNDVLDDYFDKDDVINDIWKKRAETDPSLPYRNKLDDKDMAWMSLETDDRLELAYNFALEKDKVMSYGS